MKINRLLASGFIFLFLILTPVLAFTTAFAATIRVPGDYLTIQAGIDAAVKGDTVLVADGTYRGAGNKNLNFNGKAITVQSENGPGGCIIDCENWGRGFLFDSGEGNDSVISGFTITKGNPQWIDHGGAEGGGIKCEGSSPTINNCVIRENIAGPYGGGISLFRSSAIITNCTISGNKADSYGGGIWVFCGCNISITDSIISNNSCAGGHGGGISSSGASITISRCVIKENTSINHGGDSLGFQNCGESIASISIINSLIINKEQGEQPIAFSYDTGDSLTINNSTISGFQGVGFRSRPWDPDQQAYPIITNSIFWGKDDFSVSIRYDSDAPFVTYSDVRGGYSGEGNIDSDPLFVGKNNYSLTPTSPCIDTGTSDGAPDIDIDGTSRPQGLGYDMGAYEFSETDETIYIDGCDTGVIDQLYKGKFISDWINECAADARNHGDFMSCVAKLTNELKKAGVITGREKGAIQSCAAQATG